VTVRVPAERIVSTMQSATEWLVALGAGSTLVARTDFDRQPELAALPSIGGGYDPSPEAIAALRPDAVLGWRMRGSADLARALASFRIPVVAVEATDTAEAFAQLAVLAALVGQEARGAALADSLRRAIAVTRARSCPSGTREGTALLVLSTEPPMAAGGGTWMSELLGAACLANVFADLETPWGQVSLEAITARNPAWIITGRGRGEGAPDLSALVGWRDLPAVREGRILAIDADLYSRLGPRMAEWVAAIAAARAAADTVAP
jgi:iron complex transport system substrate-binding protein